MILLADFGIAARTVTVLGLVLRLVDDGSRHDTCGNGDDGVTQQHDEG